MNLRYHRGLSTPTQNNYFSLKICHMSCPRSIRPTCIPASKLHSSICIVEIESPLRYARVIWGGIQIMFERPSTTGKENINNFEAFWPTKNVMYHWSILRFLETSRCLIWGKLIMLRCHTFHESVWLHCLHPRESPCICFGSWWPCMFFQQRNNISSFVFQKKAKRLSTPIVE